MEAELNLLIVDDDRGDRANVMRSCKRSGLQANFLEAEDIQSAEALLDKQEVDCVLLDYALPGEDGLSGLAKLHKHHPYMPMIMVTCRGDEIIASSAFKSGAVDYLSKDHLDQVSFREIITEAVNKMTALKEVDEQRADLERFADIMAHDLLSPIVHISNFVDIIEDDYSREDFSRLGEHLAYIKKSARNLSKLVKTLGEYAQAGRELHMEKVHLGIAVKIAADMLQEKLAARDARIHIEEMPEVAGNLQLLGQVFQNLLANAVKFNRVEPPEVWVSARPVGEFVEVRVRDNGIGIDPEKTKEIFKPFKRLHGKNEFEGSGLGLATVERVIRKHGGRIWVESKPGEGTAFVLELPAAK